MASPASDSPIYRLRATRYRNSEKKTSPAPGTILLSNYVTTTYRTMWGSKEKEKRRKEVKKNYNSAWLAAEKCRPPDLGTQFIIWDLGSRGQEQRRGDG